MGYACAPHTHAHIAARRAAPLRLTARCRISCPLHHQGESTTQKIVINRSRFQDDDSDVDLDGL